MIQKKSHPSQIHLKLVDDSMIIERPVPKVSNNNDRILKIIQRYQDKIASLKIEISQIETKIELNTNALQGIRDFHALSNNRREDVNLHKKKQFLEDEIAGLNRMISSFNNT